MKRKIKLNKNYLRNISKFLSINYDLYIIQKAEPEIFNTKFQAIKVSRAFQGRWLQSNGNC